jgi:hypothetical protein
MSTAMSTATITMATAIATTILVRKTMPTKPRNRAVARV